MNPPTAIQNATGMSGRKPFTYTPGGIDLSEIKSEKMAQRLIRNAMNPGVEPKHTITTPQSPNNTTPYITNMPVQVFPNFVLPPNPKALLRSVSAPNDSQKVLEENQSNLERMHRMKLVGLNLVNGDYENCDNNDSLSKNGDSGGNDIGDSNVKTKKKHVEFLLDNDDKLKCNGNRDEDHTVQQSDSNNNETELTIKLSSANQKSTQKKVVKKVQIVTTQHESEEEDEEIEEYEEVEGEDEAEDGIVGIVEETDDRRINKMSQLGVPIQTAKITDVTEESSIQEEDEEDEEEVEEVIEVEEEFTNGDITKTTQVTETFVDAKSEGLNETVKTTADVKSTHDENKLTVEKEVEMFEKEVEMVEKEVEMVEKEKNMIVKEEETGESVDKSEVFQLEINKEEKTEQNIPVKQEIEEEASEQFHDSFAEITKEQEIAEAGQEKSYVTQESVEVAQIFNQEQKEIPVESKEISIDVSLSSEQNKNAHHTKTEQYTQETESKLDKETESIPIKTHEIKVDNSTEQTQNEHSIHTTIQSEKKTTSTVTTNIEPSNTTQTNESNYKFESQSPVFDDSEKRRSLLLERLSVERQLPSAILNKYSNSVTQARTQQFESKRQVFLQPETTAAPAVPSYNYKPTETESAPHVQDALKTVHTEVTKETISYPTSVQNEQKTYVYEQKKTEPYVYRNENQPLIADHYNNVVQNEQKSFTYEQPQNVQPSFYKNQQESLNTNSYSNQSYDQTYKKEQVFSGNSYTPDVQNEQTHSFQNEQHPIGESNYYQTYQPVNKNVQYQQTGLETQQQPGYVPPPWEQDPNQSYQFTSPYQTNNIPEYQPLTQQTTIWQPQGPKPKKQPPLAYIPPAPNAAFNKPIKPTRQEIADGKTFYSEYQKKYIVAPKEGEPEWKPTPIDDDNEQGDIEPPWRKELREFTERTNTFAAQRQEVVNKPEWQATLRKKTFVPTEPQDIQEQPWRKELREFTQLNPYAFSAQSQPAWTEQQTQETSQTQTYYDASNYAHTAPVQQSPAVRPASYTESANTFSRPPSGYHARSQERQQNRQRGVSVDRFSSNTIQQPYKPSFKSKDDYSLPWERKEQQRHSYASTQSQTNQSDYTLPWEKDQNSFKTFTQTNDYKLPWETNQRNSYHQPSDYSLPWETKQEPTVPSYPQQSYYQPQSQQQHESYVQKSGYQTLPRMPSEHREATPHRTAPRQFATHRQSAPPVQSRSFKYLQMITGTEDGQEADEQFVMLPPQLGVPKPHRA